jgi:hypothetical protein
LSVAKVHRRVHHFVRQAQTSGDLPIRIDDEQIFVIGADKNVTLRICLFKNSIAAKINTPETCSIYLIVTGR